MTDRRRYRRFALAQPLAAEMRVVQDVVLEAIAGRYVSVIARTAGIPGEARSLSVSGSASLPLTLPVRTVASELLALESGLRYRIVFEIAVSKAARFGADPYPAPLLDILPTTCVLVHRWPARLLEVSARGCLLETPAHVVVGDFAVLEVAVPGQRRCVEMIRVCRTARVAGAAIARASAEFMPVYETGEQSIRQSLARAELFAATRVIL